MKGKEGDESKLRAAKERLILLTVFSLTHYSDSFPSDQYFINILIYNRFKLLSFHSLI